MLDSRRSLLVLLCGCLLSSGAWARETVVGVRLGLQPDATRVVLDLSGPTPYRVGLLASPSRLYIELPNSDPPAALPNGRGLVRRLSFDTDSGLLRLLATLGGPVKITKADLIPGTAGDRSRRLVVDLSPASGQDFAEALAAGPIDSNPPIVLEADSAGLTN